MEEKQNLASKSDWESDKLSSSEGFEKISREIFLFEIHFFEVN